MAKKKMYKNWPQICELGKKNRFLMLALATMNLSVEEEATAMVTDFLQCFTGKEIQGPVPLSVIRMTAQRVSEDMGTSPLGAEHPESYWDEVQEILKVSIPLQTFELYGNHVAGEFPLIPKEISPDSRHGDLVQWEGQSFVVIDNNPNCEELSIAPVECISID